MPPNYKQKKFRPGFAQIRSALFFLVLVLSSIRPALAQEESLTITGRIVEAGTRDPLEDVMVRVGETEIEEYSDASGHFSIEAPLPGPLVLKFAAPGYKPHIITLRAEELEPGALEPLKIYLTPRATRAPAMVIEARRSLDEITRHSVSIEEAEIVPGTFGDPVRVVQSLPGVNRSPYALGVLIIRGSFPYESGYFIEGTEFPLLYHFLGVTSSISGDLLEKIDYLPGGYGVRFGRLMGGIVNLELKPDFPGRLHGYVDIDVLDSSLYVQGSVGSRFSYAIAARRSYMDLFLEPIVAKVQNYQIRAPRYWDAQLRLNYKISDRSSVRLMAFGSSDTFALLGEVDPDAVESSTQQEASVEYLSSFSKLMLQLYNRMGSNLTHELTASYGPELEYLKYGSTLVEVNPLQLSVRDEWKAQLTPGFLLRGGLDFQGTWHQFSYDLSSSGGEDLSERALSVSASPYLEGEWALLPNLRVQPGIRFDPLWSPSQEFFAWAVDPRLALRYDPMPDTELSFAIGQYSQFPQPSEFFKEYGNNQLTAAHAIQAAAGVKQRLGERYGLEATAYYNSLRSLVTIPTADPIPIDQFIIEPESMFETDLLPYTNAGAGRAYGLELLARRHAGDRWFGWVAYSLGRSERKDSEDSSWYPFEYDQTHVLTALGSYELGKGWTTGLRFRYATGNPFTPYENRYQNVDTGGYVCVSDPVQGLNYARLAPFHALDARVDKNFVFETWKMGVSLEVQNAYNRKNVEIPLYNYDCNGQMAIYGLPIVPVLGVKGQF